MRELEGVHNFREVAGYLHDYKKGDVAVIQPIPGHPHGHMCMYDGDHWVSDFKQRTLYPGESYRAQKPRYVVYRR